MLKPDITERKIESDIVKILKDEGFDVLREKKLNLSKQQAEHFYGAHRERVFFDELVEYITSGDIVALLLQKDNAVEEHRLLMGATNPSEAKEGTIRKNFGLSICQNSIHGSDSNKSAEKEINFFFGFMDRLK